MKQNPRVSVVSIRVGAVILAIATMAAMVFAILNFDQRSRFESPDDGVAWWDTDHGVAARLIVANSPAQKAGIRTGDIVKEINGASVRSSAQVANILWHAGLWTQVRYKLVRSGEEFETPLVTAPTENAGSVENYLRFAGVLFLFIGFFILWKRWNAPRAIHFFVFCLVSFIFCSFHYRGKLDTFDYEIYWANIVATMFAPALLLHFALVFPERGQGISRSLWKMAIVYAPAIALLILHVAVASRSVGFIPWVGSRFVLAQLELSYFALCCIAAGLVFYLTYRKTQPGVLRQQLKWLTAGTLVGSIPCSLLYILPFALGLPVMQWMKFSVLSLISIPICFGYAIVRYRLMDVDIIFKRGLAYTAATAGVLVVFFAFVAVIGLVFHTQANGTVGGVLAIVIAASIFEPFRQWFQGRLDRFFYRDRLDYRRTLIEFGSALTNEVRLDPMLGSVMDRISQTLLVDRIAVFVEDQEQPGQMRLARSMGLRVTEPLDLSFIDAGRPEFANGALFFESPRVAEVSDSVRQTLEQLDLNYFIPCRIREQTIAVLGLGKTVDGDFLSSDDVELVKTIGGYVAVALDNAQLYSSLEQKALEIARLKDFSENIVESLNIGVLAVDLTGIVESWNTRMEQLFGVARTEAVGRKLDSLLPADLAAEILSRSDQEQVTGIYKQRLHHQGKTLTMNVSITPLVSKSGERIGRLLLFDDVTQREHMAEQMSQTEKLTSLGLLAAGVAHEVNTPLAVISNYIQMLAKQMPEEDPRHAIIEKIVKQTFRASEIVNNLLNFSRTGPGEIANVDVNKVVEETLSLVAHPMKTSQIQVVKNLGDSLPSVRGSANKLQQVFLNLFLNARDAMPSGGMLEVKTLSHNGSVEIEIADTGAGISREHIHKIFDPFFTTKATGRGTGLGLSVSYGIIKEHAGKIDVRSTPGKGTSFHVEFPAVRKPVHV
jgi:PAS domain S-box-containing protein